jgi:ComF family protein
VLTRWLGDLLSPHRCAACSAALGRAASVFCRACSAGIERCAGGGDVIAFAHYGGALALAIQSFKYGDSPHLARPLGALLRHACRLGSVRADIVIPVPLHPKRLVERGYNQSALLARHVADELSLPLTVRALARVVDTVPQAALSREARHFNVDGAFSVERPALVAGRAIALVDDVSTTGATIRACRKALVDCGATEVTSVVVARTI